MRSQIKWYSKRKGYGFIEYINNEEIFVHHTNILSENKSLDVGDFVEFKIEETSKGLNALEVSILIKT